MKYELNLPLSANDIAKLKVGDVVTISGTVYTARDAAHKRIANLSSTDLPFDFKGAAIYYCGPAPAASGEVIGACGPTTSARMDKFTPLMLSLGANVLIGKGDRSQEVQDAIKATGAVYLSAVGGAGAYYQSTVKNMTVVAFEDLGCEAVYALQVEGFEAAVRYK